MNKRIDLLTNLGATLVNFGSTPQTQSVIEQAAAQNEWFEPQQIIASVEAIRTQMLDADKLHDWLWHYPDLQHTTPRNLLIVMAGNIPLVGIFDLICGLVAGHRCYIKPSSKDRALMEYIVEELKKIDPSIPIYYYNGEQIDLVIATGGESANKYFKATYGDLPTLLRGNRTSIAVIDKPLTNNQLELLCNDIYSYSGLGCRNVSMIFLPKDSSLQLPKVETSQGYRNNYLQNRAILTLTGQQFVDTGSSCLIYSQDMPSQLSSISLCEYDSLSSVEQWIAEHNEQIQCIVSECIDHPRCVGFGESQRPRLMDYPDAVDVLEFLK